MANVKDIKMNPPTNRLVGAMPKERLLSRVLPHLPPVAE